MSYISNSTSLCYPCFYGSICQFTTTYYSISIEALPDTFIQSKRTIAGIFFILLMGTICNILSIAVFYPAKSRQMGNGIYRLWIAIIGQLDTMVLAVRLLRLFSRQNSSIVACFALDYLISVLPAIYYSLTACVAIERVVVAYQHLSFKSDRSRHIARVVIPSLVLYHFVVTLHELFHRQLLSASPSSNRFWCSLHLRGPFLRTYKNNLITPSLLMLLLTPRLIVTVSLTCIARPWQNTAYLAAYFLSLTPLMGTLFIFVLPSSKRREEFWVMFPCATRYARVTQLE